MGPIIKLLLGISTLSVLKFLETGFTTTDLAILKISGLN